MRLKQLYEDVYSRLIGHAPLVEILGGERVFDFMPGEETPGPYIVIGDTFERHPGPFQARFRRHAHALRRMRHRAGGGGRYGERRAGLSFRELSNTQG